jgi:hypothetical protein
MDQSEEFDRQAHAAGPTIATPEEPDAGTGARNIVPAFLTELARAMQAAAERERDRISEVVTKAAAEQVEKARIRAAAETEELRRLAEEDVARIKDSLRAEIERLRRDADRRTEERHQSLQVYLAKHESIIATEIDGVDAAIRGYRAALDRFFEEFRGSTDPADIARRAGSLPEAPDLDEVRAIARSTAIAELANVPDEPAAAADTGNEPGSDTGTGLGVMDPEAVGRSDDLPVVHGEVDAEAASTSPTAPPADALHVEAEEAVEVAVAQTEDRSSPAVRLLRSIAPWTTPADDDKPADNGSHSG